MGWRDKISFFSIITSLIALMTPGCAREFSADAERSTDSHFKSTLPGFRVAGAYHEQEMTFRRGDDVRIHINAPAVDDFHPEKPVELVFYALPNDNSIEQTAGKTYSEEDDRRFSIQNIAAQTRWLRKTDKRRNLVVAYLETAQKSWPAWSRNHPDRLNLIAGIADSLLNLFGEYKTFVVLSGHSGGGSFIFGFIDSAPSIPDYVQRIAFLDSDYNYNDGYGAKIVRWLDASPRRFLSVLAYNDSVALFRGEPVVSPGNGTWERTGAMYRHLAARYRFNEKIKGNLIRLRALDGRITFELLENPDRAILHTVQVERNGFIHTLLAGSSLEEKGYAYYGDRVYDSLSSRIMPGLRNPVIPPRPRKGSSGSAFMERISSLSFEDREREIFGEISCGNMPDMLRSLVRVSTSLTDSAGAAHDVVYEVMPDYLSIGDDGDFCRIPMGPLTAQALADRFQMTMPTRKLVDDIYAHAAVKLEPVTYWPVGNANELTPKFVAHNAAIGEQLKAAGARRGDLIAGIKKDVVISNRIIEPARPGHVCIYGWRRLDGKAIQPLTNIHIGTYVDYSHGVRLLNSEIMIDGIPMEIADALKDPDLYSIISDETGIMTQPRY